MQKAARSNFMIGLRLMTVLCGLTLMAPIAADWPKASAQLLDREGEQIGSVALTQTGAGVLIRLELEGLAPGPKAIHIHSSGNCADHCDGFQASGGHINPDARAHGLLNPDGPDAGDLPNFMVHDDGSAWVEFYTTRVSLDGSFGARLMDEDGAAFVIHENPDDHLSQPIGGAGARLACGVITTAD
jgi:superoxide dismutase, Cu-Zn family